MKRTFWNLAVSIFFWAGLASASPFPERPLEDAQKDAASANKLVFLDLYANWCGPCKRNDAAVFPDPKVKAWLDQYTVSIGVDGERGQGADVREKYKATAYPTLLLLKPDGTELGRHTGSLSAEDFLQEFEAFRSGSDRLKALQAAAAKNPADPIPQFQLALYYLDNDKKNEAKPHLQALVDTDSDYTGYGARRLLRLDEKNEDLKKHVDARADGLTKLALDGKATSTQLAALIGLLSASKRSEDLVKLEAALRGKGIEGEVDLDLASAAGNALIDLERPGDAIPVFESALDRADKQPLAADASAEDKFSRVSQARTMYGALYKAQLLAGKTTEAQATAEKAIALAPDTDTYNTLAWAAFEAKKSSAYDVQLAEKGHQLAGGQDLNMADTLANVLIQVGRKDEALKVIDEAIATTNHKRRIKEFQELRESVTNPKKDEKKDDATK